MKLSLTVAYGLLVLLMQRLGITCLFLRLIGVPCPGCGMTRAWLQMLRLDFAGAFDMHTMFWAVPILYGYILYDGKLFRKKWLNDGILLGIGFGFLAHWLLQLV
jgi:hypothetical protein